MINRGFWYRYTREEIPFGYPENTIFWRRDDEDAHDFYEWSFDLYEISGGVDSSGTVKVAIHNGVVSCVSKDVSMLSLPDEFTLIELGPEEDQPSLGMIFDGDSFSKPEFITVVDAVDFWSRLDDDEADAVGEAMSSQPFRIKKIFETARTFRSDHELWPLLSGLAEAIFGEARAKEILAPST